MSSSQRLWYEKSARSGWRLGAKAEEGLDYKCPTREFKGHLYDKPMNQVYLGWRYQEIQGKEYTSMKAFIWVGGRSNKWELCCDRLGLWY